VTTAQAHFRAVKHIRRWSLLTISCLLGLLLSGCTSLQEGDFDVTVVNVKSATGNEGEVQLVFALRLQNATPEAITLEGAAHKLYLNGVYVGQGLNNERIEVPRLSTVTQQVTVNLSTLRLAVAAFDIYRAQKADYRVNSTLYATGKLGTRRIHAHKEGAVDLAGLNGQLR
jgi:LEA14-like dessication related protein